MSSFSKAIDCFKVPFEEEICEPVTKKECKLVTIEKCQQVEQNVSKILNNYFKFKLKLNPKSRSKKKLTKDSAQVCRDIQKKVARKVCRPVTSQRCRKVC